MSAGWRLIGSFDRIDHTLVNWVLTMTSYMPYPGNYSSVESLIKANLNVEGSYTQCLNRDKIG